MVVLQLRRIGDVVLTTPVLESLRRLRPGAPVVLAIEAGSAGLMPCVACDEVMVFRRSGLNLGALLRLVRMRPQACLDLTGNDCSALAALCSRALCRARFEHKRLRGWKRRVYTRLVVSDVARLHTVDHYHAILEAMDGVPPGSPPLPRLSVPESAAKTADAVLRSEGLAEGFVVVHPGTVKAEKFWLPERWAEVLDWLLRETRLRLLLTCGPGGVERTHTDAISAGLRRLVNERLFADRVRVLPGRFSLPELAAVIGRARAVLCVDSAALHVAEALGTRCCALFGPTCPHQWRPRLPGSLAITPLGVRAVGPEYYPGRPMSELTVGTVVEALKGWEGLWANSEPEDD